MEKTLDEMKKKCKIVKIKDGFILTLNLELLEKLMDYNYTTEAKEINFWINWLDGELKVVC